MNPHVTADRQPGAATSAPRRRDDVEAIFPLRPLQQALLLRSSPGDDHGFLHVQSTLRGPLDLPILRRSWNEVVGCHPALRMSCQGKPGSEPMAVVWKAASIPWTEHDWRSLPDGEVEERLEAFLADDRRRGLDLADAPVMRLAVARIDDDVHRMVWTCHHLFVDGWSSALVFEEVLDVYHALLDGRPPPVRAGAEAFRAHYAWLTGRDRSASRTFWSTRLAGFGPPPRLRPVDDGPGATGFVTTSRVIDADAARRVTEGARSAGATANAMIQAAWATVVSRLVDRDDVVFGITVAGRSAPVDGIESVVGLLSNVVPVRVAVPAEGTVGEWARRLRDEQFEMQGHEDVFLSDIQAWSGIPAGRALFETLLVVENFPMSRTGDRITLEGFHSDVTTTLPLTLALAMEDEWTAQMTYDRSRVDDRVAGEVVEAFVQALETLSSDVGGPAIGARDRLRDLVPLASEEPTVTDPEPPASYVAPRDPVELQLAKIWEEVLGVPVVGARDDFFELGGTSIVAVQLFREIETALGARLPLATLLGGATIEHLATVVRDGPSSEFECLVPIQSGGSQRPIACVHAGELHVLFYWHLAKRLGPDQPVLGLEPVGRNGDRPPLESIEEMATAYVRDLRQAQPEGPYRLLGYCNAGVLCVEMARQLEAADERVELVALLDAFVPNPIPPGIGTKAQRILRSQGVAALIGRVARKLRRDVTRWLTTVTGRTGPEQSEDRVKRAVWRAFRAHQPKPCAAPLTLIWSSQWAAKGARSVQWEALGSRLDVHVVEARHQALLLEPDVAKVADLVRRLLAED